MSDASEHSVPKRHHYVPETYLRAWSDSNGLVAVRRRAAGGVFLTGPNNVGVESRLYGDGALAQRREDNFGQLEAEWPRLRSDLVNRGSLQGNDRVLASMFMAFQIARTREHIAQATFASELADFTEERPPNRETVSRFLNERYGHVPEAPEIEAAWNLAAFQIMQDPLPSFDEAFSISMEIATTKMTPILEALQWRVEVADQPVLWTGDRPVMPWRPPSSQDEFEGLGYGECNEIRFPLSPTAMLILKRRVAESPIQVDARQFHNYNHDIAMQCYEFLVCSPGRRGRLAQERIAKNRPAIRFNMAPGIRVEPDGTESPMGDIIHIRIPLRATHIG